MPYQALRPHQSSIANEHKQRFNMFVVRKVCPNDSKICSSLVVIQLMQRDERKARRLSLGPFGCFTCKCALIRKQPTVYQG